MLDIAWSWQGWRCHCLPNASTCCADSDTEARGARTEGNTRYEGHPNGVDSSCQILCVSDSLWRFLFEIQDPGLASMLAARTREAQEAEAQDGAWKRCNIMPPLTSNPGGPQKCKSWRPPPLQYSERRNLQVCKASICYMFLPPRPPPAPSQSW